MKKNQSCSTALIKSWNKEAHWKWIEYASTSGSETSKITAVEKGCSSEKTDRFMKVIGKTTQRMAEAEWCTSMVISTKEIGLTARLKGRGLTSTRMGLSMWVRE